MKNWFTIGKAKLRRRKYGSGISGCSIDRSTSTNQTSSTGESTNMATTNGLDQPMAGPRLSPISAAPTPAPSSTDPATSNGVRSSRSVSGSTKNPTTRAIRAIGT